MSVDVRCMIPFCMQPPATSLDAQVLCVPHFIDHCYAHLDGWAGQRSFSKETGEEAFVRSFLQQCVRRTVDLCVPAKHLDNLERAKLFDILLRVSEVASKLPPTAAEMAALSKDRLAAQAH